MYASGVITLHGLHDLIANQFQALASRPNIQTYGIEEKNGGGDDAAASQPLLNFFAAQPGVNTATLAQHPGLLAANLNIGRPPLAAYDGTG